MTAAGAGVELAQQGRERRGVVGQVGVHLDEPVVAAVEAHAEAVAVGVAEAVLLRAHEHVDLAELGAGGPGEVGGAVGAVVVDDEDVDRRARRRARG